MLVIARTIGHTCQLGSAAAATCLAWLIRRQCTCARLAAYTLRAGLPASNRRRRSLRSRACQLSPPLELFVLELLSCSCGTRPSVHPPIAIATISLCTRSSLLDDWCSTSWRAGGRAHSSHTVPHTVTLTRARRAQHAVHLLRSAPKLQQVQSTQVGVQSTCSPAQGLARMRHAEWHLRHLCHSSVHAQT